MPVPSSSSAFVTVLLVRHGETAHVGPTPSADRCSPRQNALRIIQGHLDTPLNEQGVAQARLTGKHLRDVHLDAAYSSDLSRARTTAEAILLHHEGLPLVLDERMRERHLGQLQGKTWGDIGVGQDLADLGVEPSEALQARLLAFWDSLFPTDPSTPSALGPFADSTPRRVLVATHGGSIRQLVAGLLNERHYVLDLPPDAAVEGTKKRVSNCSITQVVVTEGPPSPSGGTSAARLTSLIEPERRWQGRLETYADDSHFHDSSRVPSPSENVDIIE